MSRRKPRAPLAPKLRIAVIRRDKGLCRYCCIRPRIIEVDHVLPVIRGGRDTMDNLVTSCRPCNQKKSWRLWTPIPLADMDAVCEGVIAVPHNRRSAERKTLNKEQRRREWFEATRAEREARYIDNRIKRDF